MISLEKENNSDENKIIEDTKYKEFNIIKDNITYIIKIIKKENFISIIHENYEVTLSNNYLSKLVEIKINTIDEAYLFILGIFNNGKVTITDIFENKMMKILLIIENKNIEIILVNNNASKDSIINELNQYNNELNNEMKKLKDIIFQLSKEINDLKEINLLSKKNIDNLSKEINDIKKNNLKFSNNKQLYLKYNLNFKSNPKYLKFSKLLIKDSTIKLHLDNIFTIFKSINNLLLVIYIKENTSIISYDLINEKQITQIKNAHNKDITNIKHYSEKKNKRNLILSISNEEWDIKLWNANNWECLHHYTYNYSNSNISKTICASFLNDNDNTYIISNNDISVALKVYDFNGKTIKTIIDKDKRLSFIDTYFDINLHELFILAGKKGYSQSYNYNKNIIYRQYSNNDQRNRKNVIVTENNNIIKLIDSSRSGLRIWNFHSGLLIHNIIMSENKIFNLCLWNNNYILAGTNYRRILIINIENSYYHTLYGNEERIICIKKFFHPIYGECIIIQGHSLIKSKMWMFILDQQKQ